VVVAVANGEAAAVEPAAANQEGKMIETAEIVVVVAKEAEFGGAGLAVTAGFVVVIAGVGFVKVTEIAVADVEG